MSLTTEYTSPQKKIFWDDVVRRVVIDLDTNTVIQDIEVKCAPVGCDSHAFLPDFVKHIQTKLHRQENRNIAGKCR